MFGKKKNLNIPSGKNSKSLFSPVLPSTHITIYWLKSIIATCLWLLFYYGCLFLITHHIEISFFGSVFMVFMQTVMSKMFYFLFFNFTQTSKKLKIFEFYSINNAIKEAAKKLSIKVKHIYLFEHSLPNLFIIPKKGKGKIDVYLSHSTIEQFSNEEIKYLFAIELMHYYSNQLYFKKLWLFNNFYFILMEVLIQKLFSRWIIKKETAPESNNSNNQREVTTGRLIFYYLKSLLHSIYSKTYLWIVPTLDHKELDQAMLKIFGNRHKFLNLLLKIYSQVKKSFNQYSFENLSFMGYLFTVPMFDKDYLETNLYKRIKGLNGVIIIPNEHDTI